MITEILEHKHSSRFIKRTGRFDRRSSSAVTKLSKRDSIKK